MKKYFKKQLKTLCCVVFLCSAYSVLNVGIAVLLQYVVDLAAGVEFWDHRRQGYGQICKGNAGSRGLYHNLRRHLLCLRKNSQ